MSSYLNKIANLIKRTSLKNSIYNWNVVHREQADSQKRILAPHYTKSQDREDSSLLVVCPYTGILQGGGLADRLRGILSTYYVCKLFNIPFKLYFIHPFSLTDYLVPNHYDWTIRDEEVSFGIGMDSVLTLPTTESSKYQYRKQEEWLIQHLREKNGQIHVYSSAAFAYLHNYHQLFNELFKPSYRLQRSINEQLAMIGGKYISISCRFLDLLGDFNETYGYGEQLNEDEKVCLLSQIREKIVRLHKKHPSCKILCNSDSKTFLDYISSLNYTYVVPGQITHIDDPSLTGDYLLFEKTFLDFMLIASAEHIYVIKGSRMLNSGYPYAASFINKKPFKLILI